mgnify:CR=1 FL=1
MFLSQSFIGFFLFLPKQGFCLPLFFGICFSLNGSVKHSLNTHLTFFGPTPSQNWTLAPILIRWAKTEISQSHDSFRQPCYSRKLFWMMILVMWSLHGMICRESWRDFEYKSLFTQIHWLSCQDYIPGFCLAILILLILLLLILFLSHYWFLCSNHSDDFCLCWLMSLSVFKFFFLQNVELIWVISYGERN